MDRVGNHREQGGGHVRPDLGLQVISPHALQIQQPGHREDEQGEGNDRRQDLKRDRARVGQEVVALEAVQNRPRQLARSPAELGSLICPSA